MPKRLTAGQLIQLQSLVGTCYIRSLGINFRAKWDDAIDIHIEHEESMDEALIALRHIFPALKVTKSRPGTEVPNGLMDAYTAYTEGGEYQGFNIDLYETYEKAQELMAAAHARESEVSVNA